MQQLGIHAILRLRLEKKRKEKETKKNKKEQENRKENRKEKSKKKKKEKNTLALHGCGTQATTDEQSLRIVCVIGCQKFIWLS